MMNDIIMVGSIAADTAVKLIDSKREELNKTLSDRFIDDARKKISKINWTEEDIKEVAPDFYCKLSDYGIFGGLWDYAESRDCGLSVKLSEIPILQETVEVCEVFDINPYVCPSESVYLLSVKSGYEAIYIFEKKGICATVIGRENDSNDRIIINGEEKRFLTPTERVHYFKDSVK